MTQPKIDGVGHGVPRMLYASDGSNWYAILVDSDGHVKVDVVTTPGVNAYNNIPFGFSAVYHQPVWYYTPAAADYVLAGSVVPAGELWVVTSVFALDSNTNPTKIELSLHNGINSHWIEDGKAPGINKGVSWSGSIYLVNPNYITAGFAGCALNDNLYLDILGYKMKIA